MSGGQELHRRLENLWGTGPGVRRLTAVNHTVVGARFVVTGFVFFLIGGLLAMLIRAQLATADNAFLDHETYNQVFTMHGTIMMFLFALPVLEGVAMYLLPKMLGARDLAYPRLSAYGYWCYLFGGTILILALAAGAAPDAGWFMYTPLSSRPFSPGINSDVWLLGVTFVEISAICAGVELVASVLKLRAPGMSLDRLPIFAWYMLVVAAMILAGFPPLVLGSMLLEIERAFGWPFFDATRGGDPLLWQHLFWLFGHPEVYILFLPAAGLVSTMVPVYARHPLVGYSWVVASVVATAFISFGLWVHHMFTVGIPYVAEQFFSAASMLVAIPTAVQVFSWIATLWAGRPVLRLPLLYLSGFLATFVLGGLTGVMVALVPFDWQAHDTHFVVAHLHYVLVGGIVFPLLAAVYHWMPQATGQMPSPRLGHWAFWLLFAGFHLTFFMMHLTGLLGMPRRVYVYPAGLGWEWLNLLSSIGGFVFAVGVALFAIDVLIQCRIGARAPQNPWQATTLEWAMPAPAPSYNFASIPTVADRDPLRDTPGLAAEIADGAHYLGRVRGDARETLAVDAVTGRLDHLVVLPGPSWLPLQTAAATGAFFVSFLFSQYALAALAAVAVLALALRWAWTNGERSDPLSVAIGHGERLLPQSAVARPPGWWGMLLALMANGSLFVSLLFGWLYVMTVAPGAPPEDPVRWPPLPLAAALASLAIGVAAAWRARASNRAAARGRRDRWLLVLTLAGASAAVAAIALPWTSSPPTARADAAVAAVLAGYVAFHALLGSCFAAFVALRCRAGFVSPARAVDLGLLLQWWIYTGLSGAVALTIVPVLGWAMAR